MTQPTDREREVLERALKNKALLETVTPVVAYGFGVLPIQEKGALAVACSQAAHPLALRLLARVLEREVTAVPVSESALQSALARAYPLDEACPVNFPTFQSPDFLELPEAATVLRSCKEEKLGEAGCRFEEGIVLASLTYKACLVNLEHPRIAALPDPRRIRVEVRDTPLAWCEEACGITVGAATREPPVLFLNEFRVSEHRNQLPGTLHAEHGVRGIALSRSGFPHVIHPTEVQLLRLDERGGLVFHVYDKEVRIAGEGRFSCEYWFLSFGQRLHRRIGVHVHEVLVREAKALRTGIVSWRCREVARWFGLEGC